MKNTGEFLSGVDFLQRLFFYLRPAAGIFSRRGLFLFYHHKTVHHIRAGDAVLVYFVLKYFAHIFADFAVVYFISSASASPVRYWRMISPSTAVWRS